ncbi:MAG: type II toxin-antitoxin system PemK/MazF family toxin [Candidatus Omnitrophota bacterium]
MKLQSYNKLTLATVSKSRLFKRAGSLSEEDMLQIAEAIKVQLDI